MSICAFLKRTKPKESMDFSKAIEFVLKWESGYVDDPNDPGGTTKFGISKRQYPEIDIASLTKEQAIEIYKNDYWNKCRCDELPEFMRLCVFDTAVNCGVPKSIMILQECVNSKIDGLIGDYTVSKANQYSDKSGFVISFITSRILYYASLPGWKYYSKGWVRRSLDVIQSDKV